MHPREQTIFALSSGRPPSAIAMVRVSGPQAGAVLSSIVGKMPAPRLASRALLRDASGQPIDDAVVLWFPGPASATGEDVAEFHVHGGRAVLKAFVVALSGFAEGGGGGAGVVGGGGAAGAGGVYPPRLRERQARPHRGRRARRPDPCRHRPATPPG